MQDGLEAAQVALGEAGERPFLEQGQDLVDAGGRAGAGPGEADGEGPAVLGSDLPGDVAPGLQAVQVAGERGAFVGKGPVQLGHRAGTRLGEVGEEMTFPLREPQRRLGGVQVEADAVRGPVNEGDELEAGLHTGIG